MPGEKRNNNNKAGTLEVQGKSGIHETRTD